MMDAFHFAQRDDPAETLFPPRLKSKTDPPATKPPKAPSGLDFLATAKNFMDLEPLMCVLRKHPQIAQAIITAMRDEGHGS